MQTLLQQHGERSLREVEVDRHQGLSSSLLPVGEAEARQEGWCCGVGVEGGGGGEAGEAGGRHTQRDSLETHGHFHLAYCFSISPKTLLHSTSSSTICFPFSAHVTQQGKTSLD